MSEALLGTALIGLLFVLFALGVEISIAIPEMERRGYARPLVFGSLAAGGTLGILIPPSVPMIIYGVMTETSIGHLYMAGIIPGVLLAVLFAAFVIAYVMLWPETAPRS